MKNTVALRNSPSSKLRENSKKNNTHTHDAARLLGSRLGIQVHPAGKHGMYSEVNVYQGNLAKLGS